MNKVNRAWGVLVLVVFVTGCPDGPPQILRDERNTASEVADYLSKVTDNDSAVIAKSVTKTLQERWESIKKRREMFLKLAEKAEKKEFGELQKRADYAGEMEACMRRLKDDARRIALLPLDPVIGGEVSQFESKVFGGPLKIPPDPTPDEKKPW